MWRCRDETLREKLMALRTAMPTKALLKRIALRHKAWSGHREPTAWDLQQLYSKVPHTTVAACTRRAAAHVNELWRWPAKKTRAAPCEHAVHSCERGVATASSQPQARLQEATKQRGHGLQEAAYGRPQPGCMFSSGSHLDSPSSTGHPLSLRPSGLPSI